MEHAVRILVNAVITGPCPVAVTIGQGHINGQEPEGSLHVEDWLQFLFQLVIRRFIENFAQLDQVVPGLFLVL